MGRRGQQDSDVKSQLVLEICSVATRPIACVHRNFCSIPAKSRFIDWYRLLGVKENAEVDVIRRHYHKLALQLHPDKNKHPKAEIAFKLVLEAYTCLSDKAKRKAFNSERLKYLCVVCNGTPYTTHNSPSKFYASKPKTWNPVNWSRSYRIVKDARDRLKEETRVIENILRANEASRKESPLFNPSDYLFRNNSPHQPWKETPIFNPSDYISEGYPHLRARIYKKTDNFCYLHRGNVFYYEHGRVRYDSPIFENRPERGMLRSKSACVVGS